MSDQSYKYLALFLKAESFCPGKKLTFSHAPATTQNAVPSHWMFGEGRIEWI